jgi:hypothetical protein
MIRWIVLLCLHDFAMAGVNHQRMIGTPLWWSVAIERSTDVIFAFVAFRNIAFDEHHDDLLVSSYTSQDATAQYEIHDDSTHYCQSTLKSLTIGQRQICLLHIDHMPVIIQGTDKGM